MSGTLILTLHSGQVTLEVAGAKAANLAKLARAGYPIPDGFVITTDAYLSYVASNHLQHRILQTVETLRPDDMAGLGAASQAIRDWFSSGTIPPEVAAAIRKAYTDCKPQPVAVRSSATAEDLPEMSFAGQQATFLNVVGEGVLIEAVVNCWSSLWTARAIGYRIRNGIAHQDVALAVVVQAMVPAEVSGVLFTANPLTGVRTESVIDAALGLGEALVSGKVDPDHYVVDPVHGKILGKTLGAKAIALRGAEGGGLVTVQEGASARQALPDEQILQLACLGQRVAGEFGSPQDIEWAWADREWALLQSRPITTLYPLPEGMEPLPLRVMASFAAVQGFLEPMTPLGQDAIRLIFAGGGSLFGSQATYQSQGAIHMAGERLWIDITAAVRNGLGRKIVPHVTDLVEPTIGQALASLKDDSRLLPEGRGIRPRTIRRFARFLLPFWGNILRSWRDPDGRRTQLQEQVEERLATLQARSDATKGTPDEFARRVDLIRDLRGAFPFAVPNVFSAVIGGLIPFAILQRLAGHLPQSVQGEPNLALEIMRGLPHNVTTEMDLSLWSTAQAIRSDACSAQLFREASAQELAADYLSAQLPQPAQQAIAPFMARYGMRGPGEIDLGRPRWRQDPSHIMQTLQGYMRIEDESQAPDEVFRRGARAAREASAQLEAAVRDTRGGWLKARVVRWATRRFRALAGLRESPKSYIVRAMGIIRQGLLESGEDLVAAGILKQPEDLFFLYLTELESLARESCRDWGALVVERRGTYEREKLRRQIPRLLLSDGQAFYEGLSTPGEDKEEGLVGSPVSPGIAEGPVRVVLDPGQAQLAPGEILVCPGTDPAWTPLFLSAGGLVMEVGGMMTHGSVVAREYGLPAVVGVHEATRWLKTGQRVRVDGYTGRIVLLD